VEEWVLADRHRASPNIKNTRLTLANGIVKGVITSQGDLKPHLIRYWLTPPKDEHREETIKAICQVYQEAGSRAEQGERTLSTDELTGVQALERKHPGLPLVPGKVERGAI
jgi:hypothetical protein